MAETVTHTPGPWKAMTDDFGYVYDDAYCAIDDGSKAIAYVMLRDRPRNRDIAGWEANARLIAAAPEMLAALHDVCAVLDMHRDESGRFGMGVVDDLHQGDIHEKITDLIAKATGADT